MSRNLKFYVYHLINSLDGQVFYVGKGKRNRLFNHERQVDRNKIPNNNKLLYYKIKKIKRNGGKLVYKKILVTSSEYKALNKEKKDIKKFGRVNNKTGILCNLTDGGEGTSGLVYTNKMRKARSKLSSGSNNPMFGKRHSDKTKQIISDFRNARNFSFKHSLQHKKRLRLHNPGGIATSLPVERFDLEGNFLDSWNSCTKAAKEIFNNSNKIILHSISKAAKNHFSYKGYFWIYKTEHKTLVYKNKIDLQNFKIRTTKKKLIQKSLKGKIIKIWESSAEACRVYNLNPSMITWSHKVAKPHKNYYWEILNA